VEVPQVLARNAVAAWGIDGQRFIDELPARLDSVTQGWGLTVEAVYPLSFHWVCSVRTRDGDEAVLKLGPSGVPDLAQQVATLRHFDGVGAVRLLAHDVALGAMLLEKAIPGTVAGALIPARDLIATAAIITVMRRLHRPLAGAVELPELASRNRQSFVEHLARYPGDTPFPRRLVTRAMGLCDELSAGASERVVLHGDLHHDNVLRASRDPWLAIDPHGVVGDPGADIGAMLYNPDIENRDPALLALVPARIEQLADGLGIDVDRVVAWGFVGAVLSEVWTAEEPGPITRALDVALSLEPRLS
jgi:streptomycin 6-kinase